MTERKAMEQTFKHNQFTATFSKEDGHFRFIGNIDEVSGACGNRIAKIYPAFQILEDLHLANAETGEPMHALETGFYYYKASGYQVEALEKYWKVKLTDEQKSLITNIPNTHKKQYVAQIMEEIKPLWKAKVKAALELVSSIPSDLTEIDETVSLSDFDHPEKVRALAGWLDVHFSIIKENTDYDEYTTQGIAYQVLTDAEADEAWDKSLESYINECVLPDMPETLKKYFNVDKWKRDAKADGRGHSLGRYDGTENEVVDPESGETFFVYRQ